MNRNYEYPLYSHPNRGANEYSIGNGIKNYPHRLSERPVPVPRADSASGREPTNRPRDSLNRLQDPHHHTEAHMNEHANARTNTQPHNHGSLSSRERPASEYTLAAPHRSACPDADSRTSSGRYTRTDVWPKYHSDMVAQKGGKSLHSAPMQQRNSDGDSMRSVSSSDRGAADVALRDRDRGQDRERETQSMKLHGRDIFVGSDVESRAHVRTDRDVGNGSVRSIDFRVGKANGSVKEREHRKTSASWKADGSTARELGGGLSNAPEQRHELGDDVGRYIDTGRYSDTDRYDRYHKPNGNGGRFTGTTLSNGVPQTNGVYHGRDGSRADSTVTVSDNRPKASLGDDHAQLRPSRGYARAGNDITYGEPGRRARERKPEQTQQKSPTASRRWRKDDLSEGVLGNHDNGLRRLRSGQEEVYVLRQKRRQMGEGDPVTMRDSEQSDGRFRRRAQTVLFDGDFHNSKGHRLHDEKDVLQTRDRPQDTRTHPTRVRRDYLAEEDPKDFEDIDHRHKPERIFDSEQDRVHERGYRRGDADAYDRPDKSYRSGYRVDSLRRGRFIGDGNASTGSGKRRGGSGPDKVMYTYPDEGYDDSYERYQSNDRVRGRATQRERSNREREDATQYAPSTRGLVPREDDELRVYNASPRTRRSKSAPRSRVEANGVTRWGGVGGTYLTAEQYLERMRAGERGQEKGVALHESAVKIGSRIPFAHGAPLRTEYADINRQPAIKRPDFGSPPINANRGNAGHTPTAVNSHHGYGLDSAEGVPIGLAEGCVAGVTSSTPMTGKRPAATTSPIPPYMPGSSLKFEMDRHKASELNYTSGPSRTQGTFQENMAKAANPQYIRSAQNGEGSNKTLESTHDVAELRRKTLALLVQKDKEIRTLTELLQTKNTRNATSSAEEESLRARIDEAMAQVEELRDQNKKYEEELAEMADLKKLLGEMRIQHNEHVDAIDAWEKHCQVSLDEQSREFEEKRQHLENRREEEDEKLYTCMEQLRALILLCSRKVDGGANSNSAIVQALDSMGTRDADTRVEQTDRMLSEIERLKDLISEMERADADAGCAQQ
ncbi:hypothetical protein SARC_07567 [Sphaeroforma arctica JP610]|uniref:Uncharacterized protein n=1 Tax=Sphaeroforma arctica JP610 TaxID=667725 RepID=A0A0L0FVU6_9EUKA|nr:hypothetical protein SARC_07567 [Sphaeroforma arctica JP610]KNC80058.1 hypothetical protein SARC_07567 [Sphaeroforma arctica JP610]|eukprot:XP_014153960.1 hypothetical protein SARC_07567 [Sphaeroforma arctica JP610]